MPKCPKCKVALSVVPYGCICHICERFYFNQEVMKMPGFSKVDLDFEMIRFSAQMSFFLIHLKLPQKVFDAIMIAMDEQGGLK